MGIEPTYWLVPVRSAAIVFHKITPQSLADMKEKQVHS
jgi:hypothetical protein